MRDNYSYPLDLSWSTDEMTSVLYLLNQVEKAYENGTSVKDFLLAYQEFKKVIRSKAEEKRIDREFEKVSGYSTYQAVTQAKLKKEGRFRIGS